VIRIEEAIREWKAPGSTLVVPYWLALKTEALHSAGRLCEALDAVQEAEAHATASVSFGGLLNCIDFAQCCSWLLVVTTTRLSGHSPPR
jgi:hypothetical protein